MIVRVRAIGRSVPTPIAYKVERLESTEYEFEVDADASLKAPKALDDIINLYRDRQMAELNALETRVLAKYGGKPAKDLTPITDPDEEVVTIQSPALTPGTRHELRRLALTLQEAGGQPPAGVPVTEAEGQALARQLADDIASRRPAEPAAAWPAGESVAAVERYCRSGAHGKDRVAILSREWSYSVANYGKPLCRPCQGKARNG